MDLLTQLRSEWKMISAAPIHFVFVVVASVAAASVAIWKVMNWRWRGILENTVAQNKAERAELKYQFTTLRAQRGVAEGAARRDEGVPEGILGLMAIPQEIYTEVTPTGRH